MEVMSNDYMSWYEAFEKHQEIPHQRRLNIISQYVSLEQVYCLGINEINWTDRGIMWNYANYVHILIGGGGGGWMGGAVRQYSNGALCLAKISIDVVILVTTALLAQLANVPSNHIYVTANLFYR